MRVFDAIYDSDLSRLERYLAQGGDPNLIDGQGSSLLHTAVCCGEGEMVLLLLKAGASVRAIDAFGNSPLHIASMFGQKQA
ncbi:MAG: ankyrin repeat domain-containing protein, partial [Bacteroidota bacterium]